MQSSLTIIRNVINCQQSHSTARQHYWGGPFFHLILIPSYCFFFLHVACSTNTTPTPSSPWQQRGHARAYGSSFSLCLPRLGSPGGIYTSLFSLSLFTSTAALIIHPITFSLLPSHCVYMHMYIHAYIYTHL